MSIINKVCKKITVFWLFLCILSSFLLATSIAPKTAIAAEKFDIFDLKFVLEANVGNYYEKEIMKVLNPEVLPWGKDQAGRSYLPENPDLALAYTTKLVFTAYNSEVAQCDDTPCITANGFDVCKHDKEDTIAMNGIKFGTRIRIPDLFGDRVFVVRDRMNSRYGSNRADIWMRSKPDAIQFGVKMAKVEVLK